jgi:hypothetical protein
MCCQEVDRTVGTRAGREVAVKGVYNSKGETQPKQAKSYDKALGRGFQIPKGTAGP